MIDTQLNSHLERTPILPLHAAQPDEFLPPIGQWVAVGGLLMLGGFVGALLLSSILPYKRVVKAPASIRPIGELRLVQVAREGRVARIEVRDNQTVQVGQAIAYLDDTQLQIQRQQIQNSIIQIEQQLSQNQAQLQAIKQQLVAETEQSYRTVAAAEAEFSLNQRTYQEHQITTVAEFQEAEAALTLTQEELNRYHALAQTGAVAELQIREKEAAVAVASARLKRMEARLNPSSANVEKAREQIVQAQAQGAVAIARLTQAQAQLGQQRKELEIKLGDARQELKQLNTELESTIIRAPISGIIQVLTLRNPAQVVQVGDTIVQIAPSYEGLVVKAFVAAQDIDKVAIGQSVQMRVSACLYSDYGSLRGTVQSISPDAIVPESKSSSGAVNALLSPNQGSYEVTIQPGQLVLKDGLRECTIQSGMEGRADIISRQETVLQFILSKVRLLTH